MPDWNALVRERLSLAELSQAQQDEITAELASHLDELCEKYRTQGLSESEAVTRAIHEVTDWRGLAKTIQRAKLEEGTMNHRTKRLWLPGLVSTTIALVLPILLLMALTRLGLEPRVFHARYGAIIFGFLELAAWALGGAAGAFLSRRAGGERFARIASALCAIAVLSVAICFVSGFVIVARGFGAYQFMPWSELACVFPMVAVFGVAQLFGALPFLSQSGESGVSHA